MFTTNKRDWEKVSLVSSTSSSTSSTSCTSSITIVTTATPTATLPTTASNCFVEAYKGIWSCRVIRRKQLYGILAIIVLLLYVNSTLLSNEIIPVIHYSHVPGMKAAITVIGENSTMDKVETTNLELHATMGTTASAAVTIFAANSYKNYVDILYNNNTTMSFNYTKTLINIPTTTTTTGHNDDDNDVNKIDDDYDDNKQIPKGYLVWSQNCQMENIDPYTPEVMKYFYHEKYKSCTNTKPLTSLDYNKTEESYILRINEKTIPYYSKTGIITCCYQAIERNATGNHADKDISLTECISFNKRTKLLPNIDNVLVRCRAKNKQIYINGHAMMPMRPEILKRQSVFQTKNSNNRPPSVLMIGIDSISRINLIRAMPKTAQYLYDNGWFEMSGYNKIDDNTFPNLMAVLTGRNKTNAFGACPPTVLGGLDNCNFIWRTYQQLGYVTAYAEDECAINTFNYLKLGFEKPPVDYYMRPFLLAAEKHLSVKLKTNLIYCLGYKHAAEHVYDYAVELATRYNNTPYFGLFWANTFSHNAISDPTSMDERMLEYMKKFDDIGTLNNTIVIFFSDHGMRFGPTRNTNSGHYEERLPFLFISLPPYIKESHADFVTALKINKNRLTNPYDLHMTLKHVLTLTNTTAKLTAELREPAVACASCQTLFKVVPRNRSCEEISIADHWCTCMPFEAISKDSKLIHKLSLSVIDYINNYVQTYRNGSLIKKCAKLSLQTIEHAYRVQYVIKQEQKHQQQQQQQQQTKENNPDIYRLVLYTKPNRGLFEATVRYNETSGILDVTGEISRLNSYATDSECVSDGGAKKYCSCHRKKKYG